MEKSAGFTANPDGRLNMVFKVESRAMKQAGFTLIEALVTVAVLTVIVGLAAPSFSSFLDRQNIRAANQFGMKALTTARTQAMLVDAASSYLCWNLSNGVITVADTDTSYNLEPGQLIVVEGVAGDFNEVITLGEISTGSNVVFDNDADNCIGFDAQGRLTDSSNPAVFGMTFCRKNNDPEDARRIEVNAAGRVTMKLNTDTTGLGVQTCN